MALLLPSDKKLVCLPLRLQPAGAAWRLLCRPVAGNRIAPLFCVAVRPLRAKRPLLSSAVLVSNTSFSNQATVAHLHWELPNRNRRLSLAVAQRDFRSRPLFGPMFRGVSRRGPKSTMENIPVLNRQSLKSVSYVSQTLPAAVTEATCSSSISAVASSPASKAPSKRFPPSSITSRCPMATWTYSLDW